MERWREAIMREWMKSHDSGLLIWGRWAYPVHLGLLISTGTIAISNLFFDGIVLDGTIGNYVGLVAALACLLMFAAWWSQSYRLMRWGLLCAVWAWSARTWFAFVTGPSWPGIFLSLAWCFVSGGLYLLERRAPRQVSDE